MSRPCLRNLAAVLVLASSAGAPLWSMMKGAAKAAEPAPAPKAAAPAADDDIG